MRDIRIVPSFELRRPPFCGPDSEEFLARSVGKSYEFVKPRIPRPTFPSVALQRLREQGFDPRLTYIPLSNRVSWLRRALRDGAVMIWVRAKPTLPFYSHIVDVADRDGHDNYFVMDDRLGEKAHDPSLPIGNARWSEEHLLSVWRHLPWSMSVPALQII